MKKITKNLSLLFMAFMIITIVSCGDDNDEIIGGDPDDPDTPSEFDARLNSTSTDSLTATVALASITDGKLDVFITVAPTSGTIRRLYATVNEQGQGIEAYDIPVTADKKRDGSLELDQNQGDGFSLNLDITTTGLSSMSGDIVYQFWATSGKGDFRDETKRQVSPVLTLTLDLSGDNPETPLISVADVELFAPTADLLSQSFVSTADGMTYALNDFEFSDLWDIGYSAQADGSNPNGVPRLSSASGSPQRFFDSNGDIITFQTLIADSVMTDDGSNAAEDLNMVYFVDIDDSFDFDGASTNNDLSAISTTPTTNNDQAIDIPVSASGDLIAFIDQYGKIGVIRIDMLVDGDQDGNYFESNDLVQIDIKVQH